MINVERVEKEQWKEMSESAHRAVFSEIKLSETERIDYALLATEDGKLYGYCTVRELDQDSIYWQYGGAFPPSEKSIRAVRAYEAFIKYCSDRYKRISTLVSNENIRYLRLAMAHGFRIIGVRTFRQEIFVELLNEFEGA